eukprot:478930_1
MELQLEDKVVNINIVPSGFKNVLYWMHHCYAIAMHISEEKLINLCGQLNGIPKMIFCMYLGARLNAVYKQKLGIKYLHKSLKILKGCSLDKRVLKLINTICSLSLSVGYYGLQKLTRALFYHPQIELELLTISKYVELYYNNALDFAFYFEEYDKINMIFAHINKSSHSYKIRNNCIWYFTAKMRHYIVKHDYKRAMKWYQKAAYKLDEFAECNYDISAFKIWGIYLMYYTQNELKFDYNKRDEYNLEVNGSGTYGFVFLVMHLEKHDIKNQYILDKSYLIRDICLTTSYGKFQCAKLFFKNAMYSMARKYVIKSCTLSPELPIIKRSGDIWKQIIIDKCKELCCSYCGVNNHNNILKSCGGCGKVQYCSRKCQKKSWKYVHGHICLKDTQMCYLIRSYSA